MSTNLLETYGWTLRATLDHRVDPILWTHSSSDVLGFLSAGDATVDVDGDGLADSRELRMFGTSTNLTDTDGDGLSDGAEIQTYGLHALSADTDGDALPDGREVSYGLDALSSSGEDGLYGEPDADGLVNLKECQLGTSPTNGADPAGTDITLLDYDPENGRLRLTWDSAATYDSYGYALYTQGDELNEPLESDNGMQSAEVEFDELPEDPGGYTLEAYAYEGATTNSVDAFAATNFLSLWCPIASITAEVNAETRATSTATSEGTAPTAYVCTSETATVQLTAHEAQGAFPSGAPRWSTGEDSASTIDVPVPEAGTVSNYWAEWTSTRIYINVAPPTVAIIECHTYTNPSTSAETKYEIATIPDREDTNTFTAVLEGCDTAMDVTIKYERSGSEADVTWEGTPGDLYFTNGEFNVDIVLLDGSNSTPKMATNSGVLEINGVQQGDRIIVEGDLVESRDELAVVKNFTWNDLQRRGNLEFAPEFSGLSSDLKDAVVQTIIFCLGQTPGSAQSSQRTNDVMPRLWSGTYTNISACTNLCVLPIPSALGIGSFTWDYFHWHLLLETNELPYDIAVAVTNLDNVASSYSMSNYPAMESTMREDLVGLLNMGATNAACPLTVHHTYEGTGPLGWDLQAVYVDPAGNNTLESEDPIRNIKTYLSDKAPLLHYVTSDEWLEAATHREVWQAGLFVDRDGKVVMYGNTKCGGPPWAHGEPQIYDACK